MSAGGASPRALLHPRVRSAFREAVSDCGVDRLITRIEPFPAEAFDDALARFDELCSAATRDD